MKITFCRNALSLVEANCVKSTLSPGNEYEQLLVPIKNKERTIFSVSVFNPLTRKPVLTRSLSFRFLCNTNNILKYNCIKIFNIER